NSESYQYDGYKRLTSTTYLDGTSLQNSYQDCCSTSSTTDRDGTVTSFTYDALKRLLTETRNGVMTSNIYDAYGNLLQRVRYGTNGNSIALNISTYDDAGRLTSSRDPIGNTNFFSETLDGSGQLVKTTTLPNGSTRIETQYRDGDLAKLSGTAVHGLRYANLVVSDSGTYHLVRQEIKLDASGNDTSEWTKNYLDG